MIVYFIRHGETDFNKRCLIQGMSDIPLNDKALRRSGLKSRILHSTEFLQVHLCGQERRQPSFRAGHLKKCSLMQESVRWILV